MVAHLCGQSIDDGPVYQVVIYDAMGKSIFGKLGE
jgi:hypothetical protein